MMREKAVYLTPSFFKSTRAKEKGMTVSFDGNFRSTLWSWEEARDFCTLCLPYVDVLFGIEPYHIWKDEENHNEALVGNNNPVVAVPKAQ